MNHAVSTTGEPRPRYALPEPDHSTNYGRVPTPDQMQPSGTAKDVPARMNRLSGIKTRLNLDPTHAGPMKEKTKTNWEHFHNNLFTINLHNEGHRADLRGNKTGKIYNDQIKTHAILLKGGATHSDENKPRCMAKDPRSQRGR